MLLKMQVLEKTDIFLLENLSESKEEVANCPKFAEFLASGVDIFINDSFSSSHKVLASTVGVPRFCCTSLAGFYFEETLCQLKKAVKTKKKPYMAIIGGGNLFEKEDALQCLASKCNGLIFVGMMSLQILHVLGHYVPPNLLEPGADKPAINIIQLACDKKIPIFYPKDFWCVNDHQPTQMEITSAHGMKDGWRPIDLGPLSLDELDSLLTQCKKIICFGPMRFKFSSQSPIGVSRLAKTLDELSQKGCDITIVGNAACNAIAKESAVLSSYHMIENAAVVWEFFRGRRLPGIMALDRAYPFKIDWGSVYEDTTQPLVVDVGSGNGLFLLGMAKRRKDLNFLGLEINKKLVSRCLDSIDQHGIGNGYFIATNATSTFYSLVSSYPGKLEIVSIQCPNPDFKNPKHRWRMLQRSLVEAVIDLLAPDGKVFLQTDVLGVALRMVKLFLKYGKDKLIQEVWLQENPFGVRSDWEQHVIDRGDPMYRVMLMK
ncbi:hypothetical protein K2173_015564 [Erythroxylum novogranatense]|uniref:Phosphoglycerate kinase n=1 Tax=Erythroxylum novogranatense TaxID=1862640 RepID=A0AAV8SEG3_9ROSI|nr:hypothetical protein K2173_015564 [Erythroxylum novogranatense]